MIACCHETLVTLGFFATLCVLGACFVAFTWILARSIDRSLEVTHDDEEDAAR